MTVQATLLRWVWPARQVPPSQRAEFEDELAWALFLRSRALAAALGAFHLLLLAVSDLPSWVGGRWDREPGLQMRCVLHFVLLGLCLLTLLAGLVRRPAGPGTVTLAQRALSTAFPIGALLWGAAMSVNDQLLQAEITVYIATALAFGAAIPLAPDRSILGLGGSLALFVAGIASVPLPPVTREGHYLNSVGVVLVAWVLSALQFESRVRDFLNRHTIAVQREALDAAQVREQRQQLELKLLEAQRLESLGLLAGGVAHDFNNLLGVIRTNVGLALSDLPPNTEARESLEDVQLAVRRAADLSNQMLAYSGRGRFVIRAVDLSEVVSELARLAASTVPKKCALKLELPRGLPAVEADLAQLRQVVLNLITNAAEAVGDRTGQVVVRTALRDCDAAELARGQLGAGLPPGRYVALEVVDDGEGMSPEVQARIFDPFFSTKFTGRGLGLAAVLGILRGHQGAMHITSAPGQGSTFRVLLPASTRPAERLAPSDAPTPRPLSGTTVLVVDDEEMVLRGAQRFLARAGYQVLVARDGRAGVEQFRGAADRVQAVLLDLSMPGMDGFEVMQALREIRPETPILLTSGYTASDLAEQMRGAGVPPPAAFLQKPYDTQVLLAELQRLAPRPV